MSTDHTALVTYPPDISCFYDDSDRFSPAVFKRDNYSVTGDLANLNLTDLQQYLAVYCLNPPADDGCPYGYCPNPDIAGPLVRIANYVTGLCLAVLIFYSTERVKAAFWSQVLITYSLLITCGISLIREELGRLHSIFLVCMVCSPVNVYFVGYSIRAFWSSHRLDAVLGKKQYARRAMVLFSLAVWVAVLIYTYLPPSTAKFSQDTCKGDSPVEIFFIASPIVALVATVVLYGPAGIFGLFILLLIPILIAAAWVTAIIRRRKEIWPDGRRWRPRFGKVWRTVVTNYPFLRFLTFVVVPTAYWAWMCELGIAGTQDVAWSLTFGQVLAVFTTVPPIIEVCHTLPELWRWFINLAVVRFITRRPAPEPPASEEMGASNIELGDWQKGEKNETVDSLTTFVAEQPRSSKTQADSLQEVTEYGQS